MNILFVADVSIIGVIGGAERVLFEQSTRLAQLGHNVHILTRALPAYKNHEEFIQGVREWRYDVDFKNAVTFLKTTRHNCRRLFESHPNKNTFNVMVLHQPFSAFSVIQSPFKQTKKIYCCHSLSFEEYISRNEKPESMFGNVYYWLNIAVRKWIEKKVLNESDIIIVLSQFTKNKLEKNYHIPEEKIAIIPGGVDLEKFQPATNRIDIRKKLDLLEDKVILFTVRNLVQRMGLESLIKSLSEIKKYAPDILMVIGGDGPLREELEVKSEKLGVKDYIRFEGFIPEELLPDYYKMADIFILPTKELEGFGLVTLESMASGVPVLGTPVGGTKEILGKFDPSFLFKDTASDSISDLIIEKYRIIKNNPEKWKEISINCRRFVEENYSWERHVDALEKHF